MANEKPVTGGSEQPVESADMRPSIAKALQVLVDTFDLGGDELQLTAELMNDVYNAGCHAARERAIRECAAMVPEYMAVWGDVKARILALLRDSTGGSPDGPCPIHRRQRIRLCGFCYPDNAAPPVDSPTEDGDYESRIHQAIGRARPARNRPAGGNADSTPARPPVDSLTRKIPERIAEYHGLDLVTGQPLDGGIVQAAKLEVAKAARMAITRLDHSPYRTVLLALAEELEHK